MISDEHIVAREVAELIGLATQNYVAKHLSVQRKDEVSIVALSLLNARLTSYVVIIQISIYPPPSFPAITSRGFGWIN